jgi:hypothetical protein
MAKEDVTLPRMLHKTVDADDPASPANRKRVETLEELAAALKDGWVLSAGETKAAKAEAKADAKAEKA